MSILPRSRPKASRELVERVARAMCGSELPPVYVLGVRGYYLRTMGDPARNDRGIYDDAMFVCGPSIFASYNANTDPSVIRKGIATLVPGVHLYRQGKHGLSRPGGGYPAFRPATRNEELPVTRDGVQGTSNGIAINIHRGSRTSTSSEGCQTIYPDQWAEFHGLLVHAMQIAGVKTFPYILTNGPI